MINDKVFRYLCRHRRIPLRLEKAGGFECVGYCEIDRYAKKAYETMYDTEGEVYYDDARKINQTSYPISTLYAEASLAKAFQSLEKGADLTTQRNSVL